MKLLLHLLVVVMTAVVLGARPKSECEKQRDWMQGHEAIMKLIPESEENGDYKQLQCYEDINFCVCYNKQGYAVSPISSKIKECGCHLRRKEEMDRENDNAHIPQCNEDGSWAKKQCWDYNDSCWCVDNEGNQQGDIVTDGSKLNCE